mmetsp:Transcript_20156/g.56698  ORF Transcript_20156/g.56698 Transcript_20156/m.56698 type:complete len:229 (-) Transcript_20156:19-705(-)
MIATRFTLALFVCVAIVSATEWPCKFQLGADYYDLTPLSGIVYEGYDEFGLSYFYQVCDPTVTGGSISSEAPCMDGTQVCQDLNGVGVSCGVGEPSYGSIKIIGDTPTSGVQMITDDGTFGCGNYKRSAYTSVVCLDDFPDKSEGYIETVTENPSCIYFVKMYSVYGCANRTSADNYDYRCCSYASSSSSTSDLCLATSAATLSCPAVENKNLVSSHLTNDCSECTTC